MRPHLVLVLVLLLLAGCSSGETNPRPVASATLDYFPARIWGTGNSVSPKLELEAGTYTPFMQAFDRARDDAQCVMFAALIQPSTTEAFKWDMTSVTVPSTKMPGMGEGTPTRLEAGTYWLEVDTACEWLVMLDWQPE